MSDEVKAYILDFCAYDLEPLHLLLSAVIERQLCASANSVIPVLLVLVQDKFLECYHHSTRDGEEYHKIDNIKETDLAEYIRCHETEGFRDYPSPEQGGEYFFKTTTAGCQLIED